MFFSLEGTGSSDLGQRRIFEQHGMFESGYIGSLSFLEAIVKVIEILRERNPNLHYGEPP
jgi:pyridoxal/pyridoxine/pyridoxamine kinase